MSYVALAPSPRLALLSQAGSRWEQLAARRPDLRPAVELQRNLVAIALELLDAVETGHVPRLSLPPRYVAAKLGRAVPALTAEPIMVPSKVLAPSLIHYCEVLAAGGAGQAAANVAAALREGRIEPGSLLTASLNRDLAAIRKGAEHLGLAPDLVWLVAELSVSPFVHAVQRQVFSSPDSGLAAALDRWEPGYCPACGSWPAIAERVDGRVTLRCSFCALAWTLPSGRCAYCRAEPPAFRVVAAERGAGYLELCDACRGYLKVTDLDSLSPFPLVAVSDLETTDLDLDAMAQGYQRPVMERK